MCVASIRENSILTEFSLLNENHRNSRKFDCFYCCCFNTACTFPSVKSVYRSFVVSRFDHASITELNASFMGMDDDDAAVIATMLRYDLVRAYD